MRILAYYIVGSCDDGTIYKFIIIGILLYKPKVKMRVEHTSIRTTNNGIYDIVGDGGIGNTSQYLVVFIEDVVAYAQSILAFAKGLPCRTIRAMHRNHLYQTIGIYYDLTTHCL